MSLFFKSVGCECPGCSSSPCDPPSVPASTFYKRTASASKTKCGYTEWAGYESTPPKYYLQKTLSGVLTQIAWNTNGCSGNCIGDFVYTYGGSCFVTRSTCVETVGGTYNLTATDTDCSTVVIDEDSNLCDFDLDDPNNAFPISRSATVKTASGSGCLNGGAEQFSGVATITLSNEFTTALLVSDVDAAIPAFSGVFSTGSGTAFYDVTTNELTATKRALEYKFELPALVALGYTTYRLDWVERFTPEGGSPSDTAKFYQWNGSATETGVYTVSAPSTQGTTSINNIVASCL